MAARRSTAPTIVSAVAAAPGDYAQLLGPDVPIDEAAEHAGTIAYELLVRLGPRAERRYVGRSE